jgi:hypothetical protein
VLSKSVYIYKVPVMKRVCMALVVAGSLLFWPLTAEAGGTRVYFHFGIGGAIALGSGLIFWNIGYSSRLAQRQENLDALKKETFISYKSYKAVGAPLHFPEPPLQRKFESHPSPLIEFPLLTFRW